MRSFTARASLAVLALTLTPGLQASLTLFQSYAGNVGLSTDGWGSTATSGTISAAVPAGSSVIAAYLYTAYRFNATAATASLNGVTPSWGAAMENPVATGGLGARRADVTGIVKPIIDSGSGGVYNFTVEESHAYTEGEALVVVYSNPALPSGIVKILDGWSAPSLDSVSIIFSTPIDPAIPNFVADLRLGISWSCCEQATRVWVNGNQITWDAGGYDDGDFEADGSLITVGGFDDPFANWEGYELERERYNISSLISRGDIVIDLQTKNPSGDDNLFLAALYIGQSTEVPEPTSAALLLAGLAGLLVRTRRC